MDNKNIVFVIIQSLRDTNRERMTGKAHNF